MVDLIITPPFSSSRLCVKSADSFINVNIVNAREEPQLNGLLQTMSCPPPHGPRELQQNALCLLFHQPWILPFLNYIAALEYNVRDITFRFNPDL